MQIHPVTPKYELPATSNRSLPNRIPMTILIHCSNLLLLTSITTTTTIRGKNIDYFSGIAQYHVIIITITVATAVTVTIIFILKEEW